MLIMKPSTDGMPSQPLSGRDYAVVSFVMVALGIALLLLFVGLAPRMVPANILNQFFYIVLIVWGVICAIVLFGVLRSYAHLTYKYVGGVVELGGPAVFAALVVVGGFVLVPRTDTFDLTVRPYGPGAPIITSGKIRVEFGNFAPIQEINQNGEADFKGVSQKFRGATVKILPQIDGYEEQYQPAILDKDAIDLLLVKAPPPQSILKGKIVPTPAKGQIVRVLVQGEDGEEEPDSYGRFKFAVHKRLGERVRVNVCANGRRIYDDYQTLIEEEVEITTRRPDVQCSN
jgi:hypothetical protein